MEVQNIITDDQFQNDDDTPNIPHHIPQTWNFLTDTLLHTNFQTDSNLLIYTITWNLHGQVPTKQELQLIIPTDRTYHLYVIATQECMRSIASSFFYSNKDTWVKTLGTLLGENYFLLSAENLSAFHIAVFGHQSIKAEIKEVATNKIKTGVGNVIGNKGAVAVSFVYKDRSFLLINCHLAAGHDKAENRNRDFQRINQNLALGMYQPSEGEPITDQFDVCIWLGDMNYRINMEPEEAVKYINDNQLEHVLNYDQLSNEVDSMRLDINCFNEGRITFKPTYKYKPGSVMDYDLTERTPGWTDRILYKSKRFDYIVMCKYGSFDTTVTSDHKPVYAVFRSDFERKQELDASSSKGTRHSRSQSQNIPSKSCGIF